MNLLKHALHWVVHVQLWVPRSGTSRSQGLHGLYLSSDWQRHLHPWIVANASQLGNYFISGFRGVQRLTQPLSCEVKECVGSYLFTDVQLVFPGLARSSSSSFQKNLVQSTPQLLVFDINQKGIIPSCSSWIHFPLKSTVFSMHSVFQLMLMLPPISLFPWFIFKKKKTKLTVFCCNGNLERMK